MKSSRGQNLVELALLLPILLLILAGMVDLGRGVHAYTIITNAAREGARYGSMHPDEIAFIQARAISEAEGSGIELTPSNVQVSTSTSGNPIRVTVTYTLTLITGLILGGEEIQLQSSVEMIIF
ncbi:TPA: pilus assembly protein [Candidatus Bipolaricaulota bacterium]|nr:pilus assembly protein [Candidatus Bipolaricaulota bacterium]